MLGSRHARVRIGREMRRWSLQGGCMQAGADSGTSARGATITAHGPFFARGHRVQFYLGIPTLLAAVVFGGEGPAALHAGECDVRRRHRGRFFAALVCTVAIVISTTTAPLRLVPHRFGAVVLATAYGGVVDWSG